MMTWLSDPSWQGVAAILTLVSIVAGIAYVRRPRLSWGYSSVPLITVSPGVAERLDVRFQGQPVRAAHVQRVTVVNVGAVPVPRASWDSHLTIRYGEGARVIAAEVSGASPVELTVDTAWISGDDGSLDEIQVAPLLLNPGDGFKLTLVVDGTGPEVPVPEVSARIAGVSSFGWFDGDSVPLYLRLVRSAAVTAISMGLLTVVMFIVPESVREVGITILGVLFGLISFVIVFAVVATLMDRFDPYKRLRD